MAELDTRIPLLLTPPRRGRTGKARSRAPGMRGIGKGIAEFCESMQPADATGPGLSVRRGRLALALRAL